MFSVQEISLPQVSVTSQKLAMNLSFRFTFFAFGHWLQSNQFYRPALIIFELIVLLFIALI